MELNQTELFILVLMVIVVVVVIQTSPDFQTGVLRVSLIVYTILLYRNVCKMNVKKTEDTKISKAEKDIESLEKELPDTDDDDLSVNTEPIDDPEMSIDSSEDDKTIQPPRDLSDHELLHADNYPENNRIYNTAKNRYTSCYPPPVYEIHDCNMYDQTTYDQEDMRQRIARNRSKEMIDGMVSKTSDYYKIHIGRELDNEEAKGGWWGDYNYGHTQY